MPIKAHAKKALRQAQKRAARNVIVKNAYKRAVKDVTKAVVAGEKDIAEKIRIAQKKLGKAAKRGVIKQNTAARKLSRLMKKVNGAKKK
ncbi:MAG: 30S ribosomal protein S20 [Candidatus Magasanikbacteria bacterium RIFCSPHIGHO2_02_FULL_47_14]|uniref:Small ribosomal subunit protein bS20 n=1 Tax=Candidatus Magasanikbacteria bacterium RIFCSPHIGHO2_02_FULL_47_14 TaxID=1798680 RepID=A0A1F6LYW8_9BACT|nr:MAG: 30S ribosomal protein S20 [Candidatus Magasanikbacteria bacterium RIFCSPHIGHO2_02_FULL_47_14]